MWISFLPIAVYWLACGGLYLCSADPPESVKNVKNSVSFRATVIRVAQLHALQFLTTLPLEYGWVPIASVDRLSWWMVLTGMFWLDTIEYFVHRLYHSVPFLYRHIHKTHHEMVCPWSVGALYNSFGEALLTSTFISMWFFQVTQYSLLEFAILSSLGNLATIVDHCHFFDSPENDWWKKKGHHRKHHETNQQGNFQQPFFDCWDRWLGTKV